MFEQGSRYSSIETGTVRTEEGDGAVREIRYVRRRFLPAPENMTVLMEHTTAQGERLDHIAARYLGDPTLFWRLCDANKAMRPDELTEHPGTILAVAIQGP